MNQVHSLCFGNLPLYWANPPSTIEAKDAKYFLSLLWKQGSGTETGFYQLDAYAPDMELEAVSKQK